jgi:hypothetical protein
MVTCLRVLSAGEVGKELGEVGYSAAKWSTDSSLKLAKASATRTQANRAFQLSITTRAQDASNFNAWFAACLQGDKRSERALHRRNQQPLPPPRRAVRPGHSRDRARDLRSDPDPPAAGPTSRLAG